MTGSIAAQSECMTAFRKCISSGNAVRISDTHRDSHQDRWQQLVDVAVSGRERFSQTSVRLQLTLLGLAQERLLAGPLGVVYSAEGEKGVVQERVVHRFAEKAEVEVRREGVANLRDRGRVEDCTRGSAPSAAGSQDERTH